MKQPIPFGKYYLLERINVGGMAEVFKAKATGVEGFERMVAVKRILPSIAEDEEFITMFIDEAKIAVQLTHANIAQIFDLGRFNDSYYIALEFVHGKDLRAIFNRARTRGEPLPIPMACYAIMKVCEGLDYAHNKRDASGNSLSLVHRDVSPQNILVSYEGEVKIIDFGIAKAAGKAGKTQAGILKGKFGYMSPEQVQGMEIDRRSDIFGVGICLYELLTGERLFVGESDFATLEKVRNVEIMPPSTYNRRIPEELEQIVMRALARDRGDRHQTAMALHDDLQAFMYTSGNFFGRRDLSVYQQRVFAEELEKEKARDQEYATFNFADEEELTGLSAFDELDPVSVVSEFDPGAYQGALAGQHQQRSAPPQQQRSLPIPVPSRQSTLRPASHAPLPQKSTLLGMQPAPVASRAPSVPRLTPSPGSIPRGVAPAASGGPGLDMDWDDEELSTQIYDKPEDLLQAMDAAPQPMGAHVSGSMPAVLGTSPASAHMQQAYAPVGVPSPFGGGHPGQRGQARNDPTDMLGHGGPQPQQQAYAQPVGQGRSTIMVVAAVLAVVGAIVLGLWLFKEPAPGTIHLTTNPKDAVVKLDGQPIVGVSSPFVIPEILPGTTHTIEVGREGFRAWNSKVELQPDQVMELPTVTLEVIESGFALDSTPSGATVFVDDVQLGQVTPLRVTDLTPGHHQIRLQMEGYAPWQSSLQVTAGHVLSLPRATLMAVSVPTPAPVPTPVVAPTPAPTPEPVERTAEPRRPRRPRFDAPPPPGPGPEAEPQPEPEPEPAAAGGGTGTLRVQTRPWSQVFVDGRLIGTTPQMGIQLSAGRHTVTFVNNDFGIRKTIKVVIKAGGVETQVLTLVPGM